MCCFMTVTVERWDDRTSWNRFVASTPDAHFQQSWEWGDLAPHFGGRAVRLAATRHGEPVGAMQVFVNPIRYANRTYLTAPRGPVAACASLDVLGPLCDTAMLLGYRERAVGIRLEPNAPRCN